MIKNPPSKQLVDHAISVVLERRYRRAIKPMMPDGHDVKTRRQKRETGRGRTKGKKAYVKGTNKGKVTHV